MVIDAADADVLGDEPIWHQEKVIGWVTSGGFGHFVELSLAQGYIPSALANEAGTGGFEVEILGERRPARIILKPPFDPEGARMRL
jgi:dimethylglycine dehydrogenase